MVGSIVSTGGTLPLATTTAADSAPVAQMDIQELLAGLTQAVGSLQQVLDGAGMLGTAVPVESALPVEGGGAPGKPVDGPPSKTDHGSLVAEAAGEGAAAGNAPIELGKGAPAKGAGGIGEVEQASGPGKPGKGGMNGGKGLGGLFDGLLGGIMGGIQGFIGNGGIESVIGAVTGALGGGGEPVTSIIGGVTGFLGGGGINAVMGGIQGLMGGFKNGMGGSSGATGDSDPAANQDTSTAPPTAGSAGDLPIGGADSSGLPPDPSALAA